MTITFQVKNETTEETLKSLLQQKESSQNERWF